MGTTKTLSAEQRTERLHADGGFLCVGVIVEQVALADRGVLGSVDEVVEHLEGLARGRNAA